MHLVSGVFDPSPNRLVLWVRASALTKSVVYAGLQPLRAAASGQVLTYQV